jgi:starvation-inducible DNA-binding protein
MNLTKAETAREDLQIGLAVATREDVSEGLSRALADSWMLYTKLRNFHWNVTGPLFRTLHELFEEQYTEIAEGIDVIAERIRALGAFAPGNHSAFMELSKIEETENVPPAEEMVRQLVDAHETLIQTLREVAEMAGDAEDIGSEDLMVERLRVHAKQAWMLRATLEDRGA